MLKDEEASVSGRDTLRSVGARYTPAYILHNLTQNTIYCFSNRVKSKVEIRRRHIKLHRFCICKTRLLVFPQRLLLDSPSQLSIIFFEDQWKNNQDYFINTARKRAVTIHVAKENGENVEGAVVNVEQISKDFPIGSAISKTILGDLKTYSCYEAEQI
ncbi:Glycosyl hydrolase family 10 protein [Raphanus sativus]|nr:Glycosyl hydrolase family 10 protein [Raphanus sativus]